MKKTYKMMLVDDEYMILEGLKQFLPYDEYGIEIVAAVESVREAMDYFEKHPVDFVLTDISMPDKDGLEMIQLMKKLSKETSYIIMSGYEEFAYAKKAISLGVKDYLVKPLNKSDLATILQELTTRHETDNSTLLSFLKGKDLSLESVLEGKAIYFVATDRDFPALAQISRHINKEIVNISLSYQVPPHVIYWEKLSRDTSLEKLLDRTERSLFYGCFKKEYDGQNLNLYDKYYPLIISGQVSDFNQVLEDLQEELFQKTPTVHLVKQVIIQLMTDLYHYFNSESTEDLSAFLVAVEKTVTLQDLMCLTRAQLKVILNQNPYSPHVKEILDIISQEYSKELTLKQMSQRLFLNTVYLGQIIKKETGETFAELLNQKRIQRARQLLLTSQYGVEEICFQVGYTNVGYFYKIFKRLSGESPKSYRQKNGMLFQKGEV